MLSTEVLNTVTRKNFLNWHKQGNLLLLDAGRGRLADMQAQLNDYSIEWKKQGRPVTRATVETGDKIYMISNGCDEFIIICGQLSDDSKQHLTIYVCK